MPSQPLPIPAERASIANPTEDIEIREADQDPPGAHDRRCSTRISRAQARRQGGGIAALSFVRILFLLPANNAYYRIRMRKRTPHAPSTPGRHAARGLPWRPHAPLWRAPPVVRRVRQRTIIFIAAITLVNGLLSTDLVSRTGWWRFGLAGAMLEAAIRLGPFVGAFWYGIRAERRLLNAARQAGGRICSDCGYDLSTLNHVSFCPECGRSIDMDKNISDWTRCARF